MSREDMRSDRALSSPDAGPGGAGLAGRTRNASAVVAVDAHAHFHPCFSWRDFLEGAAANFARFNERLGLATTSPGCLLLAETGAASNVARLRRGEVEGFPADWEIGRTREEESVWVTRRDGVRLTIIAGKQIVSAERLEVLALISCLDFPHGLSFERTLAMCLEARAVTVIPWGFGKWTFSRGSVLRSLIASGDRRTLWLGDNGNRPRRSMRPRLLRVAEEAGFRVLSGSDPLPLADHARRAGSYGFLLEVPAETDRPAATLRAALDQLVCSPPSFGQPQSSIGFVSSQLRLRTARFGVRRTAFSGRTAPLAGEPQLDVSDVRARVDPAEALRPR